MRPPHYWCISDIFNHAFIWLFYQSFQLELERLSQCQLSNSYMLKVFTTTKHKVTDSPSYV